MSKRKQQPNKSKSSPGKPSRGAPRKSSANGKPGASQRTAAGVRLRKATSEDAWELVHPRCALDRAEDLEEVEKMIAAGEIDIALDELRWLLGGCSDFIDAHRLLGELAASEGDLPLARAHFGYAYRVGASAVKRAKPTGPTPYRLAANRSFFEAAKGLVWALTEIGKPEMAAEVVDDMLRCDPSDPLKLKALMEKKGRA